MAIVHPSPSCPVAIWSCLRRNLVSPASSSTEQCWACPRRVRRSWWWRSCCQDWAVNGPSRSFKHPNLTPTYCFQRGEGLGTVKLPRGFVDSSSQGCARGGQGAAAWGACCSWRGRGRGQSSHSTSRMWVWRTGWRTSSSINCFWTEWRIIQAASISTWLIK